jgi:hypothetical protein
MKSKAVSHSLITELSSRNFPRAALLFFALALPHRKVSGQLDDERKLPDGGWAKKPGQQRSERGDLQNNLTWGYAKKPKAPRRKDQDASERGALRPTK